MIQNFVFSFATAIFAVALFYVGAALMSAAAGHGDIARERKNKEKGDPTGI